MRFNEKNLEYFLYVFAGICIAGMMICEFCMRQFVNQNLGVFINDVWQLLKEVKEGGGGGVA